MSTSDKCSNANVLRNTCYLCGMNNKQYACTSTWLVVSNMESVFITCCNLKVRSVTN
jgi:hypothetical protein